MYIAFDKITRRQSALSKSIGIKSAKVNHLKLYDRLDRLDKYVRVGNGDVTKVGT